MKKIKIILSTIILSSIFMLFAEPVTKRGTLQFVGQTSISTAKTGTYNFGYKTGTGLIRVDSSGVEKILAFAGDAPIAHAASHIDGTDDIQSATNAQKGLATAAHITAIEANTAKVTESTTVSAPLVLSTYNISMPAAATGANGYLTSTDWNTFNGKQDSLGYTAEDSSNKATTFGTVNDTLYPTIQAVVNYVSGLGLGDFLGPASSTDNAIVRFNGTGGKTGQNSGVTINDNNKVTVPDNSTEGALNLTARSSEPSAPSSGDIYLDDGTNTDSGLTGLRHYTGAAWEDISGGGSTGNEVSGTFTDGDLTAGVLTISHSYGVWYPSGFSIYDNNGVLIPFADEMTITNNTITVDLSSFGTLTGTWRYYGGDAVSGGGGGAGSDTTAIHDDTAGEINAISEKASPVSADLLIIEDSEDSNNKKKVQIGNLPSGGGVSVAMFKYTLGPTDPGAQVTAGDWRTVPLNTEHYNDISGASMTSSVITLPAGTYRIIADCHYTFGGYRQIRCRNTSDSTTVSTSSQTLGSSGDNCSSAMILQGVTTIAGSKDFELQIRVLTTQYNYGYANQSWGENQDYATITFIKF